MLRRISCQWKHNDTLLHRLSQRQQFLNCLILEYDSARWAATFHLTKQVLQKLINTCASYPTKY